MLSCVIYEVRDYACSTANEMHIFNVGDTPFMQCMVTGCVGMKTQPARNLEEL